MQDPPGAEALLGFVSSFLREEVLPQLQGALAFHVRVAANAVDLARREVRLGPVSDAQEAARLAALLDMDGDLAELNERLCDEIRDRRIDLSTPGLLEHLRLSLLAKLEVDQPGYSAYRRALETWPKAGSGAGAST